MDIQHNPVFIGHGSPMNALLNNNYTNFLTTYTASIRIPKAIIVISAHWQTNGTFITGNSHPEQIYDFYGFPDELYNIRYTPDGSSEIADLISSSIHDIKIDKNRGIDHAGWAVIRHMYPNQNVPVLELSLDTNLNPDDHFQLGLSLSQFVSQGILFIGSGNIVHNLRNISFDENAKPFQWAIDIDQNIKSKLESNQVTELINYSHSIPNYKMAIPTNEHYLPLIYILGMKTNNQSIHTLYEEIQNGSISMRSIEIR